MERAPFVLIRCLGFALLALFVGACASSKPAASVVNQELTEVGRLVAQAEDAGAREYAPLALRGAQQKVRAAQTALRDGDTAEARRLAERARIDAELAEITSRAAKMQRAAREVQASIRMLEVEIQRRANNQ